MTQPGLKRTAGVARWQSATAFLAIGAIYAALPDRLRFGPRWLMLAAVVVLLSLVFITRRQGRHDLTHHAGRLLTGLVTVAVALSAVFLVTRLPGGKVPGLELLQQAGLIWISNILLFALWYWEIDGGGPGIRRLGSYRSEDLVFPQFQQDPNGPIVPWMPDFADYLFLAFNTSTAFSPTDTLVLSRRLKLLMVTQSMISLMVIAVIAARAINTL